MILLSPEILWRRKSLILGIVLIFTLLGSLFARLQPDLYQASAYLSSENNFLTLEQNLTRIDNNAILQKVAGDLNLLRYPEYNDWQPVDNSLVSRAINKVKLLFNPVQDRQDLKSRAIGHLSRRLTIRPDPHRQRIEICFVSPVPGRGRSIATNLMFAYYQMLKTRYPQAAIQFEKPTRSVIFKTDKSPIIYGFIFLGILTGCLICGRVEAAHD